MTFQQELRSWMTPTAITTSPAVELGAKAPSSSRLPMPSASGQPSIVVFLRHCGCPFAEKTFKNLRDVANLNKNISCVAVSHSDQESTDKWVMAVGGEGETKVIVDSTREVYGHWGVGTSNLWHVLSPWSLYSVYKLGKLEGIWNRPTQTGTRWQTSGSFAIDENGIVQWTKVSQLADDLPDFEEALKVLGSGV